MFCTRKQLTAKDKINILYCFYGSITNFEAQCQTIAKTARDLKLTPATVQSALREFENRGKNATLFIAKGKKSGRPRKVIGSAHIETQLLKGALLRQYAHLTIAERCVTIKARFGVTIARETLRKFYIRNGVKFYVSRPQLYAYTWKQEELEQQRFDYAQTLCDHINDPNCHILYFDESSFNSWRTQKKAWSHKDEKIRIPLTKVRGKGWTVYGTISSALIDHGYFEIHKSTNKLCFFNYVTNLKTRIKPEFAMKKLIMVMDNHTAHKGWQVKDLLDTFCESKRIPPYSCELNAVETVWSVLKQRVQKQFTRIMLELKSNREKCIQIVRDEIAKLEPELLLNLTRSHYDYIYKLLLKVAEDYQRVNGPINV